MMAPPNMSLSLSYCVERAVKDRLLSGRRQVKDQLSPDDTKPRTQLDRLKHAIEVA